MHNIDQIFFNWQHILIREVREAFQCQWASLQKVEGARKRWKIANFALVMRIINY